jgi:hypothetical protein
MGGNESMDLSAQLKLKPQQLAKRIYGTEFATTSAIPLERVVSNKDNEYFAHLECHICKGLIVNPLQCVLCDTYFCAKCIVEWTTRNAKCPIDGGKIIKKLKMPDKMLRNILDGIKIKCKFHNEGCDASKVYSEYHAHEKECVYRTVSCPNKIHECPHTCLFLNLEDHTKQCIYRIVKCPLSLNGCDFKDQERKIAQHSVKCEYRIVECSNKTKGCSYSCFAKSIEEHQKICNYRIVQCNLQTCRFMCLAKDLYTHKQNKCDFTLIKCHKGCEQTIYRKEIPSHNCVTTCVKLINSLKVKVASQGREISDLDEIVTPLEEAVRSQKKKISCLEEKVEKLDRFFRIFEEDIKEAASKKPMSWDNPLPFLHNIFKS